MDVVILLFHSDLLSLRIIPVYLAHDFFEAKFMHYARLKPTQGPIMFGSYPFKSHGPLMGRLLYYILSTVARFAFDRKKRKKEEDA